MRQFAPIKSGATYAKSLRGRLIRARPKTVSKAVKILVVLGVGGGAFLTALGLFANWFSFLDLINDGLPFLLHGLSPACCRCSGHPRSVLDCRGSSSRGGQWRGASWRAARGCARRSAGERPLHAGRDLQSVEPKRPDGRRGGVFSLLRMQTSSFSRRPPAPIWRSFAKRSTPDIRISSASGASSFCPSIRSWHMDVPTLRAIRRGYHRWRVGPASK